MITECIDSERDESSTNPLAIESGSPMTESHLNWRIDPESGPESGIWNPESGTEIWNRIWTNLESESGIERNPKSESRNLESELESEIWNPSESELESEIGGIRTSGY